MKIVFSETPSELPSYDFYKAKKERGENIPVETILYILVPLQTETTRTVTNLEKENECWEREFNVPCSLCAPTASDRKTNNTIARKLKQIKIRTYLLDKYWKILKT